MIGHVIVRFPEGGEISREDWETFAKAHAIQYAPLAAGGNVYWLGGARLGVECAFGIGVRGAGPAEPPERAEQVVFTTIWGGSRQEDLARIAPAFWTRFGGSMFADEESRKRICGGGLRPA